MRHDLGDEQLTGAVPIRDALWAHGQVHVQTSFPAIRPATAGTTSRVNAPESEMIMGSWDFEDLAGRFRDGYDSDDINRVLGSIDERTGKRVECVWEFFDDCGYGGDSEFYLIDNDVAFELIGDLWPWLHGGRDEVPNGPGHPDTWKGKRADFDYAELAGDGWHKVATEHRD